MARLTEEQAWKLIAERFCRSRRGVCVEISSLFWLGIIDEATKGRMQAAIRRKRRLLGTSEMHLYLWPLVDDEDRLRVEFASRQAKNARRRAKRGTK